MTLLVMGFLFFGNDSFAAKQNDTTIKKLSISIPIYAYFRNYEYFTPIVPGYTLFGNIFTPQLIFSNDTSFSLSAGILLQQNYGTRGLKKAEPVFKILYHYKKFTASFGRIENYKLGTDCPVQLHELPEMFYDYDNSITNPIENGEQMIWNNKFFYLDQWVDWKRMIYADTKGQEKIAAGFSAKFYTARQNKSQKIKIDIPVKALFYHNGGQIGIADSTLHVSTQINLLTGLDFIFSFKHFIKQIKLSGLIMNYRNNSNDTASLPIKGVGIFATAEIFSAKGFYLSASYWNAKDFIAPFGAPLYQSRQSIYARENYYAAERELIFARLGFQKLIHKNAEFNIQFEPYYDLKLKLFEYMYAITLRYNFALNILSTRN